MCSEPALRSKSCLLYGSGYFVWYEILRSGYFFKIWWYLDICVVRDIKCLDISCLDIFCRDIGCLDIFRLDIFLWIFFRPSGYFFACLDILYLDFSSGYFLSGYF